VMKWCEFFLYNTIHYLNINTVLGHLLLSVLSTFDAVGCILFYWDFVRDKLKLNFKVVEARNTQRFNGQQSFCSGCNYCFTTFLNNLCIVFITVYRTVYRNIDLVLCILWISV